MGKRAHKSSGLDGAAPLKLAFRRRRLLQVMAIGFLLTFLLTVFELWFESSTVAGREFQRTGYRLIQYRLSSTLRDRPLPVTIVDISDLEPQTVPGSDTTATSRVELEKILRIVGDQDPAAIAIDIDFSPDEKGWIDPSHDPEFFDTCLNLKGPDGRHIPVFLGVNRTRTLAPEFWLGNEQYEALAANMLLRRDGDTREMTTELQVKNYEALPSLATRLADAFPRQQPPFWARWGEKLRLLESFSQSELKNVHVKITEALIDHSPRTRLQKESIPYRQLQSLEADEARDRFSGKLVVIGAAELGKTNDVFSVVGEEPTPGPIVIACAANTLAQDGPLYALTWVGSIVINLCLSFVVFLVCGVLWYEHPAEEVGVENARVISTLFVAVTTLLVAVVFVRQTRVVWDGFLIVLLALAFHHRIELCVDWLREFRHVNKYRVRQRRSAT